MIKEVNGNLLTYPGIQVIGHQANCLGAFGKGFALQVKQKYPYVYETYNKYCKSQSDAHNLLGKCQVVKIDDGKYIANLFGEYSYYKSIAPYEEGGKPRHTDYDALKECLHRLHTWMVLNDIKTVGVPDLIGCGLAGGSKTIVRQLIEDEFGDDEDITFYIVKYNG